MTDTVTTEPTAKPTRVWPWIAGASAVVALIGGVVVATSGGANADDKALCHAVAIIPPSVANSQTDLAVAAMSLHRALADHPGASELVQIGASNVATYFETYSKTSQYKPSFVDGQPTADTLDGLATVVRSMAERCG